MLKTTIVLVCAVVALVMADGIGVPQGAGGFSGGMTNTHETHVEPAKPVGKNLGDFDPTEGNNYNKVDVDHVTPGDLPKCMNNLLCGKSGR